MRQQAGEPLYAAALALAVVLLACTGGEAVVGTEEEPPEGPPPGLTVQVRPDSSMVEVAAALGWGEGIPDAEVLIHRIGTPFEWTRERTDSAGVARFPDLQKGFFRVAAVRVLTESEAEEAGVPVRAFSNGRRLRITPPRTREFALSDPAPRGLVISEVYGPSPGAGRDFEYDKAQYIEVYNNSDRTIFLDGLIVGKSWAPDADFTTNPCSQTTQFREDPEGIWGLAWHQIPGSGGEFPLPPGETAVIARDGIDHTEVDPRFPDLSDADFEFIGPNDVDNPDVPNMPNAGIEASPWPHGLRYFPSNDIFVAEAVDPDALERRPIAPGVSTEIARIPAEKVLDFVLGQSSAFSYTQLPPCQFSVHPTFDRMEAPRVNATEARRSAQRWILRTEAGQPVLVDTNTSGVDVLVAHYTVGTLPSEAPPFMP